MKRTTNGPLVFVHIPKTAGTTLHKILSQQHRPGRTLVSHDSRPDELNKLAALTKCPYDLIMGHLGLGIHELFPKTRYIAFLREPIARLVSHYHYARQTPNHYLYETIRDRNLDLAGYVSSGLSGELSNGMTRTFADVPDFDHSEVDETVLAQAKHNIDNLFLFVGTSEYFDEGLMVLKNLLGWKQPYYVRRKVGSYKKAATQIDDRTRHVLEEYNRHDLELHRHVVELMKLRLSEVPELVEQTAQFREANTKRGKPVFLLRDAFRKLGMRSPV